MSEPEENVDSRPEPTARVEGDITRPPERLERGVKAGSWVTRIVVVLLALIAAYIVFKLSAAFFPRWWAQRVGNQVDGRFFAGTTWGLFYGFVFTFVPLLLFFQVRRRFFSWAWRGITLVVALLLAAPNWLTLSIVLGISNAAIAGDTIMDNDAPGFRWATLWGAILGGGLAVGLTGTSMWLKHRKNQLTKVRSERDELRASQQPPEDSQPERT